MIHSPLSKYQSLLDQLDQRYLLRSNLLLWTIRRSPDQIRGKTQALQNRRSSQTSWITQRLSRTQLVELAEGGLWVRFKKQKMFKFSNSSNQQRSFSRRLLQAWEIEEISESKVAQRNRKRTKLKRWVRISKRSRRRPKWLQATSLTLSVSSQELEPSQRRCKASLKTQLKAKDWSSMRWPTSKTWRKMSKKTHPGTTSWIGKTSLIQTFKTMIKKMRT